MLPEVTEYLNSIERVRAKIFAALEGAPPEAWNWRPTHHHASRESSDIVRDDGPPTQDETNSLFVLATHCIGSEHGWIFEILGRGAQTRNRPAEFLAKGNSLEDLRAEYERVGNKTRNILSALTEADLTATRFRESHGEVSARWILLHVIEHSSEHLGQMELTKQLWEEKSIQ